MSRTKKTGGSSSPVKKYLSFSGSKGQIKYYSKDHPDADEKGNVYVESLDLAIIDIKASISGFNENASSGISSNMLDPYAVGKEEFIVKTKVDGSFGVFAQGIYKDIKDKLSTINAKYTTNLFALADLGNGLETVRLELNGSALQPWIELMDGLDNDDDIYDQLVTVTKGGLFTRKNGQTTPVSKKEKDKVIAAIKKDPMYQRPVWFYAPAITIAPLSEELTEAAIEADTVLQEYFSAGKPQETKEEFEASLPEIPETATAEAEDDDLPF